MSNKPLVVIFITVFIDLVGFGMIIPLSTYLTRTLGGDALQVGLLMSIYSLMQFIFSPIWGRLSDRFGRRPIILVSLFGAAMAHLLFAFGETYVVLLAARFLAGVFGGNISTAMAYIADVTDEKNRSKGMGLIGAAFGLGFVLGPVIGGLAGELGTHIGAAPPFGLSFSAVVASLICFCNFVAAYFVLPETLKNETLTRRASRFQLLTSAFAKPVVGSLLLTFALSSLAMAFMEVSLFLLVKDRLQWGLTEASLGFAYVGLIMVFTQGYLIRKFLPKWGERRVMVGGLFLSAFGMAGIAFCYSVVPLAIVMTLLGLGTGFINPSINGSISLLTDKSEQGQTLGVSQSLSALGRIIGPAAGGWLYREGGDGLPFLAGGVFMILAGLIVISIYRNLPIAAQARL